MRDLAGFALFALGGAALGVLAGAGLYFGAGGATFMPGARDIVLAHLGYLLMVAGAAAGPLLWARRRLRGRVADTRLFGRGFSLAALALALWWLVLGGELADGAWHLLSSPDPFAPYLDGAPATPANDAGALDGWLAGTSAAKAAFYLLLGALAAATAAGLWIRRAFGDWAWLALSAAAPAWLTLQVMDHAWRGDGLLLALIVPLMLASYHRVYRASVTPAAPDR